MKPKGLSETCPADAVAAPGVPEGVTSSGGGDGWILLSAGCFATIPIFATYGYAAGVATLPMLAWRFLLTIATLWSFLGATRRLAALPAPRVLGLLGMGVAYVAMTLLYFEALRHSSISTLTLLFYSYPVFVTLLAVLFLREPMTRIKSAALLLALAGCVIVLRPSGKADWRGALLALAASLLYSAYMIVGTRLTRGVDPFLSTAWIMTATAAIFIAAAAARGEMGAVRGAAAWGSVLGLAVVATVMADGSFFAGLSRTGASRAAILSTVEPLFTILLSAWLLGEVIPPALFLGGALILGSVLLIHRE
jgi:drug/metabolite transporter (DMT)-like permease